MSTHHFKTTVAWSGNRGTGTSGYTEYGRDHFIRVEGKPEIAGSSDPAFRGDGSRYNPEDFLLASISACHMLWYLHLCADAGVIVVEYRDHATGSMEVPKGVAGKFTNVTLHPEVKISPESDAAKAQALHAEAHKFCFIANSVNFPVEIEDRVEVSG